MKVYADEILGARERINIKRHCLQAGFLYYANVLVSISFFLPFRLFSGIRYIFSRKTRAMQHVRVGEDFEAAGDLKNALASFTQALAVCPRLPRAQMSIGRCFFKKLLFDKAREKIEIFLKSDPENSEANFYLGAIAYYRKNIPEALAYLEKTEQLLVKERKKMLSVQGNIIMADCYQQVGRHQEAINCIQRSFRINPKGNEKVFTIMGKAYKGLRKYAEALTAFQKALGLRADNFEVWNEVGQVLLILNDKVKALQCFKQSLSFDSGFEPAKKNILITESMLRAEGR